MDGLDIASGLKGLVRNLESGNPNLSEAARVKRAFFKATNEIVRSHVTGVFVVPESGASEVIVYTDTPIWATELSLQAELYRLKLNVELNDMKSDAGEGVSCEGGLCAALDAAEQVKSLKFVASKERYVSRKRSRTTADELNEADRALKAVEPVALDPAELVQIQNAAAGIENEKLREAALAAAKASLEWQKGLAEAGE